MLVVEIEMIYMIFLVEKDVEKFLEKNEINCKDDKVCEEVSIEEENVKIIEELRKMKEENFLEKENIIKVLNMVLKDVEIVEFEDEKFVNDMEDEIIKMVENLK